MKRPLQILTAAGAVACALTVAPMHAQIAGHMQAGKQRKTPPANKIDWNAPLPSASELKARVLNNLKQSEAEQERYICKVIKETDQTDKHGNLKNRNIAGYDMFFVNGQEIDEETSKNGTPLDVKQKKKESDRVLKQIKKDSDAQYVARQNAKDEKQLDMLLHMVRYTNGHRIDLNGRSTLAYDLSGDPNVHPRGVEETFLHNMNGTIQVDETTGELVDLNARLDRDVKIAGGLLANIHKGFWIHVHQQRYPDGVWLPDVVEGSGDLRAGLFFHPYFRFHQAIHGCVLTNVSTSETAPALVK